MTNFGNPDPSWDYNYLWEQIINAHIKLEALIKVVTNLENSTPKDNEIITEGLTAIQALLGEAQKACNLPPLDNLLED